jgi:zinc and cadmium transporter
MTLLWIVAAGLAGGALSLLVAAALSFTVLAAWVPRMVSYAVGALLGAAFLRLLPEAFSGSASVEGLFAVTLAGLLGFFLLEKFALWRHAHNDAGPLAAHAHSRRGGMMIVVGDAIHNTVDGVAIAAAFLTDATLGVITTIAVIVHEVPQEVGDFMILLDAGYAKRTALLLNLLASLTSVIGGVAGYFVLAYAQAALPYVLAVSAAGFIYIAVADLIPGMHRSVDGRTTSWQVALIAAGVGTIALLHEIGPGH